MPFFFVQLFGMVPASAIYAIGGSVRLLPILLGMKHAQQQTSLKKMKKALILRGAFLFCKSLIYMSLSPYNIHKGARPSNQCHCGPCHCTSCCNFPPLNVGAHFGRSLTKSLEAPKWHQLILAPMGALNIYLQVLTNLEV